MEKAWTKYRKSMEKEWKKSGKSMEKEWTVFFRNKL